MTLKCITSENRIIKNNPQYCQLMNLKNALLFFPCQEMFNR